MPKKIANYKPLRARVSDPLGQCSSCEKWIPAKQLGTMEIGPPSPSYPNGQSTQVCHACAGYEVG